MSLETERQLERLFAELPEPEPEVSERALATALAALPMRQLRPHRQVGRLAVLVAAALVLLAVAAGAVAAAGALHVSFGRLAAQPGKERTTNTASTSQLRVPRDAQGIAAVVNGRLWLTTSGGFRLQGLPVSAAALSPHALYVAAGIGNSLVAMAPDGRRAWSHKTAGRVRSIAWAPDGLRVAYVVQRGHHFSLHTIVGNGSHDQLIDDSVRPVTPSWRADSLAFAYVSAGGAPVIYDLAHASRRLIANPRARGATTLAFARGGSALAIGAGNGFLLIDAGARPNGGSFGSSLMAGLGWLDGQLAVAVNPLRSRPYVQLFKVEHGEAIPMGQLLPPAPIKTLDADGAHLTIAVAGSSSIRVIAASPVTPKKKQALRNPAVLLTLPLSSRISELAVR